MSSRRLLGGRKCSQKAPQDVPEAPQDPPEAASGGPRSVSGTLFGAKLWLVGTLESTLGALGTSKAPRRCHLERFGINFGLNFGPRVFFSSLLRCLCSLLRCFQSSLLRCLFSTLLLFCDPSLPRPLVASGVRSHVQTKVAQSHLGLNPQTQ